MNVQRHRYIIVIVLLGLVSIAVAQTALTSSGSRMFSIDDDTRAKPQPTADNQDDYVVITQKIRELRANRDLLGLVELGKQVSDLWETKEVTYYPYLLIEICGGIASQDFGNKAQYVLAKECTIRALRKTGPMMIEHELGLVAQLSDTTEYTLGIKSESDWNEDRLERAKYWCRAWSRLERLIDPAFDVSTPSTTGKTTAERDAALKNTRQKMLLRFKSNYSDRLRNFLIGAYAMRPYNGKELETVLEQCSLNVESKRSILLELATRIEKQNR